MERRAFKVDKTPFYYKIGKPVLFFWKNEWRQGKVINGYRTHDGIINVELGSGEKVWCGEARWEEFIKRPKAYKSSSKCEGVKRVEEYLKRAKELKESVVGNYEHSTNIQDEELVDWLIEQAEKVERYEQFIRACQYAGKGGLPTLRMHANQLLRGDLREVDLSQILRKDKELEGENHV